MSEACNIQGFRGHRLRLERQRRQGEAFLPQGQPVHYWKSGSAFVTFFGAKVGLLRMDGTVIKGSVTHRGVQEGVSNQQSEAGRRERTGRVHHECGHLVRSTTGRTIKRSAQQLPHSSPTRVSSRGMWGEHHQSKNTSLHWRPSRGSIEQHLNASSQSTLMFSRCRFASVHIEKRQTGSDH